MKLITRQMLADEAPQRFAEVYEGRKGHFDRSAMIAELRSLPSPIDPDAVDRIIGNTSWTRLMCHDCGAEELSEVVQVGQEPDYESSTAQLCRACATKAANLFGG